MDETIKHGYQPLRAAALLAVVYLAVLVALWAAQHRPGLIVPAKDVGAIDPAPTAEVCVGGYPCFYPAGYAVDTVIPLLNLRQVDNWRLNGSADWGWAFIAGTGVATGLGWAFSTLAVVGFTGLVRKDQKPYSWLSNDGVSLLGYVGDCEPGAVLGGSGASRSGGGRRGG